MLIIGEKINSSRKDVKNMVESKNKEFIQELAQKQVEGGAQMLDLNIGTIRKGEPEDMKWLVKTVQEAVDVPLCIDSPNHEAIEAGLEVYDWRKGKALINSVTAEREKLELIFPLVKKYKCSVVALTMDERGIPQDSKERFKIADELIRALTNKGIPIEDIYIDPLTLPVSANIQNSNTVLETLKRINDSHPEVKTIIGLSNISYGLPERKLVNQSFVVLAMAYGLDAAILDSTDRNLMALIKATDLLLGRDEFCAQYLKAFRQGKL
ncbi:MAG TPA: methyltetrahydrofolate--corrinoid methyltransferase [Candidatus Atribacteria bacterium]|nr:methyltetrahydrofolate--corrinoid methyltransferase [Candidatus Atribacteria bacterium]